MELTKPMGRPPYQPSDADRLRVTHLSSLGIPQHQIANVFRITPKTLRKHFRHELTDAITNTNTTVLEMLYKMAVSGTNTAATIFWAKTRCGLGSGFHPASPPPEKPPKRTPQPPSTIVVLNNDGAPRADP